MEQKSPQDGAPEQGPPPKRPPARYQPPPEPGWTPGLAGGPQAPQVSTPGLPPTPGLGEQQGYASHPGLLPSSHTAPRLPYGGAYTAGEQRSESVPGLMPDLGAHPWPPPEWPDEQTPPGGWTEPLPAEEAGDAADWISRALATACDFAIWLAAYLVLAVFLGLAFGIGALASGDESVLGAGGIVLTLASFGLYAGYTGFLMTRPGPRNGQTVGKRLLGVRVVRVDGAPVSLGTVAVRHWLMKLVVFGILAAATLYIATLVNYLRPLWHPQRQAFHDAVARTRVVKAR